MRHPRKLIAIALLGALAPITAASAHASSTGKARSVTLHTVSKFKGKPAFAHIMASATLRYTKNDVFIKLTTDNLPNPKTLGQRVYMLFASNGTMVERVGALKTSGNMAGVSGQVMMTRVQDLYVYAVSSTGTRHPMGVEVLSAMV
ncbi:MAG: hypothetical protein NVS2B16_13170 [Chloroflexota bacterium]